jgi:hypothetical protein
MPTVIYSIDHDKAADALFGPWNQMQWAIARAIADERERCATVVERMGRSNGRVLKTHKVIAAEIRSARVRVGTK